MQNNGLFSEMYNEIIKAHYILLITDKNCDIDSLSSSLSLSNFFYENKIKHKIFNLSSKLPRKINFLSKFDKISKEIPKYYDLVIYLDCNEAYVLGQESINEVKTISINHQFNHNSVDMNIVDSSKCSTSELLYSFFKINKLKISKNIAECLYVGIYDESLGFTSSQTNNKTFTVVSDLLTCNINISNISDNLLKRESLSKFKIIPKIMNSLELFSEGKLATVYIDEVWIKETGADVTECDDIVDSVLNIGIVKVAVYFRVIENHVLVSLRSKDSIDVSLIARNFNGAGDKNTAALSVSSSNITEVKEDVVNTILNYI